MVFTRWRQGWYRIHTAQVVADEIPIAVRKPGLVTGELVLAVKIDTIGRPYQLPHGIGIHAAVSGKAYEKQLVRTLPRRMAFARHLIDRLFICYDNAIFFPFAIGKVSVDPINDLSCILLPV